LQQATLTTSKTTIAENESAVTATLDVPTDKDVAISLAPKGTARYLAKIFITNSAVVITTAAEGMVRK
jgi:hypothetical protein